MAYYDNCIAYDANRKPRRGDANALVKVYFYTQHELLFRRVFLHITTDTVRVICQVVRLEIDKICQSNRSFDTNAVTARFSRHSR